MPAVQCPRGMDSPANGIFFSRPAPLWAGRRRQETQGGRPRALPPPVRRKGGARRGGANVQERVRRSTGRTLHESVANMRPANSLRGEGAMFEERHDIIRCLAAAGAGRSGMAAGRTAIAETSSARVSGRIERRSLARAPDSALPPSPGISPDEPAGVAPGAASIPAPGPEAWGPGIPNWPLLRRRGTRGRRTRMGCPRGPVCGSGTFRRGAEGGSNALRPGGTARSPESHTGTMGCDPYRGAHNQLSGRQITRDNYRYQE